MERNTADEIKVKNKSGSDIKEGDYVKVFQEKNEHEQLEYIATKFTCYIIASFSQDFDNIRSLINDALDQQGITCINTDQYQGLETYSIAHNLQKSIEAADFIVAEITGYSPNVMYEVGLAHGLRKPILFMIREGFRDFPSSLSGYIFLIYNHLELSDPAGYDHLVDSIHQWVKSTLKQLMEGGNEA